MAKRYGQGIARRNRVGATTSPNPVRKPMGRQGEYGTPGSIYSGEVNEYPNTSNPRNDPTLGNPADVAVDGGLPVVSKAFRNTGRIR